MVAIGNKPTETPSDGEQTAEAQKAVKIAEAETNSKIVAVGYEVAAGSGERELEIQKRLNNMNAPESRVRASFSEILSREGVSLIAIQVTYPAAKVEEVAKFLASTTVQNYDVTTSSAPVSVTQGASARQGTTPYFVPHSWLRQVQKNKPTWASTAGALGIGIAALLGLLAIICFCMCFCASRWTSRTSSDKRASRERNAPEADSAVLRREQGDDSPSNKAGAGRLGYPPGYEPVRSEDASFLANRPPSIGSDSSEAAGLRLLGNDGM